MIKKLSKHGKYSAALVIPPSLLELLKWDMNTDLEISTPDGKSLLIKKAKETEVNKCPKM